MKFNDQSLIRRSDKERASFFLCERNKRATIPQKRCRDKMIDSAVERNSVASIVFSSCIFMTMAAVAEDPGGQAKSLADIGHKILNTPINPLNVLVHRIQRELRKTAAYGLRVSLGKDANTLVITPMRRYREEIHEYKDQPSIDSLTKKADAVDRLLAKNAAELHALIAPLAANYVIVVRNFVVRDLDLFPAPQD